MLSRYASANSCVNPEETLGVPIPFFSRRPRNNIVGRGDDRIDRFNISRIRRSFRCLRHLFLPPGLASLPSCRFGAFQMLVEKIENRFVGANLVGLFREA